MIETLSREVLFCFFQILAKNKVEELEWLHFYTRFLNKL